MTGRLRLDEAGIAQLRDRLREASDDDREFDARFDRLMEVLRTVLTRLDDKFGDEVERVMAVGDWACDGIDLRTLPYDNVIIQIVLRSAERPFDLSWRIAGDVFDNLDDEDIFVQYRDAEGGGGSAALHDYGGCWIGDASPQAPEEDRDMTATTVGDADPALTVYKREPFNAGTPLDVLRRDFITPHALFYARNHGPIPTVDPATYRLTVTGDVRTNLSLSLDDLRRDFPSETASATLQCAGNRCTELIAVRDIPGETPWTADAIGNAT